jgi:hypothetical protein
VRQRIDQIDQGGQHQNAAESRVQHELQRRIDAPLASPDADDQKHRDQHRFPEHVEQEQVLRDQRAQHRELYEQQHRMKQLDVAAHGRDGACDHQRPEKGRERDQQYVEAVEPDVVPDAPGADPGQPRCELQSGQCAVEAHQQPARQD